MIVIKKANISTISDVKKFVHLNSQTVLNVDVGEGRYIVDGKSILGIFSLDLSAPVSITVESDNQQLIDEYFKSVDEFIV